MKQTSRVSLKPLVMTVALSSSLTVAAVTATAQNTISTMTFQRSIDVPGPGPSGTVVLKKEGARQSFDVDVRNVVGTSFGVFYGLDNTTNTHVFLIAVMNRQGTNDNWILHYEAVGGAPPELPVADLDDLAGLYLFIAEPSDTNAVVNGVLFAQIPALTAKSAAPNFNAKSLLTTPTNAPPNPAESGTIKAAFIGKQGRSVFELRATHLSGGGSYTIFMEEPPSSSIFTNIGSLVLSPSTTTGTFERDTAKGETLPLQLPTTQYLSGRGIQIRDAFDQIHLQGVIP